MPGEASGSTLRLRLEERARFDLLRQVHVVLVGTARGGEKRGLLDPQARMSGEPKRSSAGAPTCVARDESG